MGTGEAGLAWCAPDPNEIIPRYQQLAVFPQHCLLQGSAGSRTREQPIVRLDDHDTGLGDPCWIHEQIGLKPLYVHFDDQKFAVWDPGTEFVNGNDRDT
jgi:hypothetical protein